MRDCINCRHAVIIGEYRKATLLDPPERPEVDGCGYEGPGEIERYFNLFDYNRNIKKILIDKSFIAEYCPFYAEVE